MTGADLAALEAAVRAGMPAAREIDAGDWIVRVSGGPTKRVNSVNARAPGARLDPVLAQAERIYREAALPVRFRLTPLADEEVDVALERRGYRLVDASWTMAAPLAAAAPDAGVRFGRADAAWREGHAAACGWDRATADAHDALLARLPAPSIAATLVEDGAAVGFAGASVAAGRIHLFDVATTPAARGRGVGRRIVSALLAWGAEQGAGGAVLQVLDDNAPARVLYRKLGFVDAYPYHYRISE